MRWLNQWPAVLVPSLNSLPALVKLFARLGPYVSIAVYADGTTGGSIGTVQALMDLYASRKLAFEPFLTPNLVACTKAWVELRMEKSTVLEIRQDRKAALCLLETNYMGQPYYDDLVREFSDALPVPCDYCGLHASKRYSGCREVFYCSRACQAAARAAHKQACRMSAHASSRP